MENKQQKNIWITGAGSGIGLALTKQYAALGHRVFVSGRDAGKLDAVYQLYPQQIVPVVFDVSDSAQIPKCSDTIAAHTKRLDLVIFAAGICEYIDLPDMPVGLFARVMNTNFIGCVNSFNVALSFMQHDDKKHIVGISSMASYLGFPRAQAYGASKAAMSYLLSSMRLELKEKNIHVVTVNPGFIKTPLTDKNDFPMPFMRTADEIAAVIVQGVNADKTFINYPYRFHLLLKLLKAVPFLWYRFVGPHLMKKGN